MPTIVDAVQPDQPVRAGEAKSYSVVYAAAAAAEQARRKMYGRGAV
jgi:hypothetical protein